MKFTVELLRSKAPDQNLYIRVLRCPVQAL